MLGEIYSEGKGSSGQPRSFRKSALERTRGGGVISKIIPDEQTNSLVILANLAGFEQLKQLVAKLDVKTTDSGRIHVYYCEYTKAEDLASTLSSLASGGSAKSGKRSSSAPPIPGGAPSPVSAGPSPLNSKEGLKSLPMQPLMLWLLLLTRSTTKLSRRLSENSIFLDYRFL